MGPRKDEYVNPDQCEHNSIVVYNGEKICQACGLVDPLDEGGLGRLTPGKAFSFTEEGIVVCRCEVISSSKMLKSRRMGDRIRRVVDQLGLPEESLTKVIFRALDLWKPLRGIGQRFYKAELALTYLACEECGIPMNFRDFVELTGADPTTTYRCLEQVSHAVNHTYRTMFAEDYVTECDLAKIVGTERSGVLKLEAIQIARRVRRLGLTLSPRITAAVATHLAVERNRVEIARENTEKQLHETKVFAEVFGVSESVVKERIKQVNLRIGEFLPPRVPVTSIDEPQRSLTSDRQRKDAGLCIRVPRLVEKILELNAGEEIKHGVFLFEGVPVLRISRRGEGKGLIVGSGSRKTNSNPQEGVEWHEPPYIYLPQDVGKKLALNPKSAHKLTYTFQRRREGLEWWLWKVSPV